MIEHFFDWAGLRMIHVSESRTYSESLDAWGETLRLSCVTAQSTRICARL